MQNQLAEIKSFSEGEIQTIRDTIAKDASPEQFALFVRTAEAAGLNPMLNHIYCIVYGGKMSLQVSVEGIMYLAKRVEGYQGVDVQLVYEDDEYKAKRVRDENGRYYWDVEHEMSPSPSKVVGCYAFAYREGFPPVFEFLKVEEVEANKKGTNSKIWNTYFNDMFKKHVVKRAAKRQFGIEISEESAVDASSTPGSYEERPRKDITPPDQESESKSSNEEKKPEDPLAAKKKEMVQKFHVLGIKTKEEMKAYIDRNLPDAGDSPSLSDLVALLDIMDMDIERRESIENEDLPG